MPFYELFGLAKPLLKRSQQFAILREAARAVYAGGGVLADIKSYGERITAYTISPPGKYKYNEAFMWKLSFQAPPTALLELEHKLKVDEKILRYIILKRKVFAGLPSTHKVSREAARNIHAEQWQRLVDARHAGTPLWWDPERFSPDDNTLRLTDPTTGEEVVLEGAYTLDPQVSSPLAQDSNEEAAAADDGILPPTDSPDPSADSDTVLASDKQSVDAEAVQPAAGTFPNPTLPEEEASLTEQRQVPVDPAGRPEDASSPGTA